MYVCIYALTGVCLNVCVSPLWMSVYECTGAPNGGYLGCYSQNGSSFSPVGQWFTGALVCQVGGGPRLKMGVLSWVGPLARDLGCLASSKVRCPLSLIIWWWCLFLRGAPLGLLCSSALEVGSLDFGQFYPPGVIGYSVCPLPGSVWWGCSVPASLIGTPSDTHTHTDQQTCCVSFHCCCCLVVYH